MKEETSPTFLEPHWKIFSDIALSIYFAPNLRGLPVHNALGISVLLYWKFVTRAEGGGPVAGIVFALWYFLKKLWRNGNNGRHHIPGQGVARGEGVSQL